MQVRLSEMNDLPTLEAIYAHGRQVQRATGNKNQWADHYPSRSLIQADIQAGDSYVVVDEDAQGQERLLATFIWQEGPDPTYAVIEEGQWLVPDQAYTVVHRIATAGVRPGAGRWALQWVLEQSDNVRIDTHADNWIMQDLLKDLGFVYCGRIYLANGHERLAYQARSL